VEVGTQVSGQIAEIRADFNDRVRQGQLIARIDPILLQQEVRSAQAALERREAEERQRRWELERAETLHRDGVIGDQEHESARYAHAVAQADLRAAGVALERARRNLAYTEIRAPIDGIVIQRSVDVGQTVAASLAAPTLFRIAGDLSRMRILAAVDESDIGRIHQGQKARFTVQAHAGEAFSGTVAQIRLQPTTLENVVNYTVVVEVDNRDGRLLPGMTATTDFLVETATGVLKVPNAALRLRPTAEMLDGLRTRRGGDGRPGAGDGAGGGPGGDRTLLWFLDDGGGLDALRVRAGLTNGLETQVEGDGLREGMQVIAGIARAADASGSSPFQSRPAGGRPRPPTP
ncbi:MAG: efflux RND transporter periplasmic adaptor subunit, partial [Candidatus Polarisedimenticolia bacterium]